MTDYTITTDFGAKDSLPSGNAGKVIKGSEFTTEFTNIKTAVNSKADSAGDTFTGAVTFDAAVTLNADVTFDTNTLFVDVSANKVGIGNTSPAYELDVTGSAQLSGGDLILRSDSDDADTQYIRFENYPSDIRTAYIRADYTSQLAGGGTSLAFGANNHGTATDTDSMVIDIEGNVGIGTTSPASRLAIHGSADVAHIVQTNTANSQKLEIGNAYSLYTGASGSVSAIASDSALAFATNDLARMFIDSTGRVGIGTTSPDTKLHVQSGGEAIRVNTANENTHISVGGARAKFGYARIGASDLTCIQGSTGKGIVFCTDNETFGSGEKARIDTSGNLLVGRTSGSAADEDNGIVLSSTGFIYSAREGTSPGTHIGFINNTDATATTVGTIRSSGSTTSYNTSSDERLKENIADSADAGSKIDAIQIRQFDWIADGSHQDYGVIAQELINVAPEAVSEGDTEEDMMGVDYSKLVPMLIKEVQALRSRVAELENN